MKTIPAQDLIWIMNPYRYKNLRLRGILKAVSRRPTMIDAESLPQDLMKRMVDEKGVEITQTYLERRDKIVAEFVEIVKSAKASSTQCPDPRIASHEPVFVEAYEQNLRKNLSERRRLLGICEILGLKTNSLPDRAPLCIAQ